MKTIIYLILIVGLAIGLFENINWLSGISVAGMASIGAWTFISGRNNLTSDEKEFIRENGDVSGGE